MGKSEGKGKRWAGNGTNNTKGRFPSNLVWDGSDEVLEIFARAGESCSPCDPVTRGPSPMFGVGGDGLGVGYGDTGTAARFFYCAKASRAERNRGLRGYIPCLRCGETESEYHIAYKKQIILERDAGRGNVPSIEDIKTAWKEYRHSKRKGDPPKWSLICCTRNPHPTVKPLEMLRYLCRLTATPTGGVILDPFAGSGSTLVAAIEEGRQAVGIEIDEQYCEIAARRCEAAGRERTAP